jgi:hypothetical protein
MKTSKTLIAVAVAALIPLGAAVAGDGTKDKAGASAHFDKLDTNRDGRISQAEAAADANIMFSSADVNGDGYLDKSEWKGKDKDKGSMSPAPQSTPSPSADPSMPQTSDPAPADTETPRQ